MMHDRIEYVDNNYICGSFVLGFGYGIWNIGFCPK